MTVTSIIAGRARALLGSSRVLTLASDGACAQIAVEPAASDRFLGLVRDDSPFLDRVRRGLDAGFTVFEGELPILKGRCAVTPRGRVEDVPEAEALGARAAFSAAGCVVVEIAVETLEVDDGDTAAAGAIPRT
jgi:hypothetical protein